MMTGGRNIFLHKIRNLIASYSADPSNSCCESIFEFSDEIDICSRLTILCYAMLCYVMLCYAMLCYAMLCYAMLCYAILCNAKLYYTIFMLCYGMQRFSMVCDVMPYCAVQFYPV